MRKIKLLLIYTKFFFPLTKTFEEPCIKLLSILTDQTFFFYHNLKKNNKNLNLPKKIKILKNKALFQILMSINIKKKKTLTY